jgi:hypothetical protein
MSLKAVHEEVDIFEMNFGTNIEEEEEESFWDRY